MTTLARGQSAPDAQPPVRRRVRPFVAAQALFRVLKQKESTHEVFRLVNALDGPSMERCFQRFAASPTGARVLQERRDLARTLSDRAALAALPEGSFGRAYLAFVTAEGLSAEGFQSEMAASGERLDDLGEDRQRYILRVRHSHDLFHVLTGYGRDFVGELSLLAFTRQHNLSRAFLLLCSFGRFKAQRDYPGLPIGACLREGARLGRRAEPLLLADWEALLPQPLAQVRRRLEIGVPRRYLGVKQAADLLDCRHREDLATA
ncbi:MAG: Coq4 family protein [Rhodothalassiaceae bacterium]